MASGAGVDIKLLAVARIVRSCCIYFLNLDCGDIRSCLLPAAKYITGYSVDVCEGQRTVHRVSSFPRLAEIDMLGRVMGSNHLYSTTYASLEICLFMIRPSLAHHDHDKAKAHMRRLVRLVRLVRLRLSQPGSLHSASSFYRTIKATKDLGLGPSAQDILIGA